MVASRLNQPLALQHELPAGCEGEAWRAAYGRCVVILKQDGQEALGGGPSVVIALSRAKVRLEQVLAGGATP